ncbi:uncharacterized protein LOC116340951 isoform X2 [Contarinia nasturtii]|uniref:uncharacterized protein LOC116340951 isoform X2 n=1 Tax=Contarinia nasturtii TaxID=265458 RepID=UPI0012D376CB|nr:uncharacterized protein LOC116340951 isoform X2 [Contarinia nasturtii]
MSVNQNEMVRKSIQINQIDSPHKFWFKYIDDNSNCLLEAFDREINCYVVDLVQNNGGTLPVFDIQPCDVILAFYIKWKKWIRGKAGQLKKANKDGEVDSIYVWAIDYGCKLLIPLSNVVLLEDQRLAYRHPINVQIGGLAGIVPAKHVFVPEFLDFELKKCETWSKNANEKFNEWIMDEEELFFEIESNQCGRHFGQLKLRCPDENNEPFSVAQGLCEIKVALLAQENYINDVGILNREDFLRLNHELTMPREHEEIVIDDEMIERIYWNDDESITFDGQIDNTPARNESVRNTSIHNMSVQNESVQPSRSGTYGNSTLNGISLSTLSVTLSVKSLNRCNVLVITDDIVTAARDWADVFYFNNQMRTCLKHLYRGAIDPLCAYGWPHIMRGNSLILIDEHFRNKMLCLPTLCTIVQRTVNDWTTSNRIEPIGIIFVNGAEEVERMAATCRKLVEKANFKLLTVFCLNSTLEIETLMAMDHIDILVTSVFCFETLVNHMSKLFRSNRLRYVWFHQIDNMCHTNDVETHRALEIILAQNLDIQVQITSQTYCPILNELFDRIKLPMVLSGDRTPFEAALFAECFFVVEFLPAEVKISDLIDKLQDPHSKMYGSIVIVCTNIQDVKYVSGCLTQSNIKCTDFDSFFSLNQLKLVNWTEQSRTLDMYLSRPNILVCEDADLNSYPIRTASHIVHYSLPDKVETFLHRFITCFGYYTEKLDRELLNKVDRNDLAQPIALIYFDDNLCKAFIEIYELIAQRTHCHVPPFLTQIIEKLMMTLEKSKENKPLCIDLITKSKICDVKCPYRHTLIANCDDTEVPHSHGFVNMELIHVLAPNHFSVRLLSYKRNLKHKSKPINDLDSELKRFECAFRDFYTCDESREPAHPIRIGEMYVYFYHNRPKRCRVLSKSTRHGVRIYLIDDGHTRKCSEQDLYLMDRDFKDFPSRAVEIFVLGYVPNDFNSKWLPEANTLVEHIMKTLKPKDGIDGYLQAEIISTFDRRLIVKDLKILHKINDKHQGKLVAENLIKYRFAVKEPINLHPIFLDTAPSSNTESESTNDVFVTEQTNLTTRSTAPNNNIESSSSCTTCVPNTLNKSGVELKSITSPSCSTDDIAILDLKKPEHNSKAVHELSLSQSEGCLITHEQEHSSLPVISAVSLDEILGSLPEHIQAFQVLTPIKCTKSTDQTDTAPKKEPKINDEEECLIDFSENDSDDENNNSPPSPFAYVRLIESLDEL